jgi:hypothetical protein
MYTGYISHGFEYKPTHVGPACLMAPIWFIATVLYCEFVNYITRAIATLLKIFHTSNLHIFQDAIKNEEKCWTISIQKLRIVKINVNVLNEGDNHQYLKPVICILLLDRLPHHGRLDFNYLLASSSVMFDLHALGCWLTLLAYCHRGSAAAHLWYDYRAYSCY